MGLHTASRSVFTIIVLIGISIAGCDLVDGRADDDGSSIDDDGGSPVEEANLLTPATTATLDINNFVVSVDTTGALAEGEWYSTGVPNGATQAIYQGGLWLGGRQAGAARANLSWVGTWPATNYVAAADTQETGVFLVTPDSLVEDVDNWPAEFGAPVDAEGNPRIYGDAMMWSALSSKEGLEPDVLQSPLEDVRVSHAVYAHRKEGALDAFFVRYDITNNSTQEISDAYAGFYADAELHSPGADGETCAYYHDNNVGYDPTRGMNYVYDARYRGNADAEGCAVPVLGMTFLEAPAGTSIDEMVASHRIMRRNDYVDPDFGEYSLTSADQVVDAMRGLSNSGQPMVNPVTDEVTKYAFSGNPVEETGWLDVEGGTDVRTLISSGPFTLPPGETTTLTVLVAMQEGASLSQALSSLDASVDAIREREELWRYP